MKLWLFTPHPGSPLVRAPLVHRAALALALVAGFFSALHAADTPAIPTPESDVKPTTTASPNPKSPQPAPKPAPLTDLFVARRFEWLGPAAPVRIIPLTFPREFVPLAVDDLQWFENRLWIAVRQRNVTSTNHLGKPRLWVFTPASNQIQPVRGALENYHPTDLTPYGKELWLSVEGGVGALHTQTFVIDGFNAYQGLTSTNIVGLATADQQLLALSDSGVVFGLDRTGTNFTRLGNAAPTVNQRVPEVWHTLASSGTWIAALGTNSALTRHALAGEWQDHTAQLLLSSARTEPTRFLTAAGDGNGAFWIGSDSGLHRVLAETGSTENFYFPPGVAIFSGVPPAAAQRLPAASQSLVRERIATAIGARMRDRARHARAETETKLPVDPITPRSRVPGIVRHIYHDKHHLWVATSDGYNLTQSRIAVLHLPTRKWIAWFHVPAVVQTMTSNERFLWFGIDASASPNPSTACIGMIDKLPLITIVNTRWFPDEIQEADLARRLAALPLKEQALHAFFSRKAAKVQDLLLPQVATLDAESLFLLAFSYDGLGTNQKDKLEDYLRVLHARDPQSPLADVTRHLLQAADAPQNPVRLAPPSAPAPSPAPNTSASSDPKALLARRDLDGDGFLNAIELRLWKGDSFDIQAFDANGDGKLDANEVKSVPNP